MRQRPKHNRMTSATRRFIIVGVMVVLETSRTMSLGITAITLNEHVSQKCKECRCFRVVKSNVAYGSVFLQVKWQRQ